MTSSTRFQAVFVNPIVVALLTSGLGLGSSTLTPPDTVIIESGAITAPTTVAANTSSRKTGEWSRATPMATPTQAELELARRFSNALSGRVVERSTPTHPKSKATEPGPRAWVCGAWEELVQGRGHGRNCEWR